MTTTVANNSLAVLTFANAALALPLTEVAIVERITEMRHGVGQGRALGRLARANHHYAVYGFSPSWQLASEPPPQHLFCACLVGSEGQSSIALTCVAVTPITLDRDALLQPLPECMRRTGAPLQYWFKHQQRLIPVTTAAALMLYIANLEKADGCADE